MKKTRVEILLNPVNVFIKKGTTAGIVLLAAAVVSMIWANSPFSESYHKLWHTPFTVGFGEFVLSKDLHHWINDGLMAVFFFVVGLELKREFIGGELSSFKKALLPMAAGFGGMLAPALVYVAFNFSAPESMSGWGVPMATDIAFALGILSLLGNIIPLTIKVFLTALAIADDLGAVIVIALFYTSNISLGNLGIGAAFLAAMLFTNFLGVRKPLVYAIIGIGGLWLAFLLSGVHATVAGVLAALAIPAKTRIDKDNYLNNITLLRNEFGSTPESRNDLVTARHLDVLQKIKTLTRAAETPLQRLEHAMHPVVAYVVMPVFALANAGIELSGDIISELISPVSLGVFFGLVIGKFAGITGMTKLMVMTKLANLPENTTWKHIYGIALLGGVGFTMSLFITELAFSDPIHILQAKLGIMLASLIAGIAGYLVLRFATTGYPQK